MQLGQDNLGELFFWRWFVDAVDLGVSRGKGLSFQFCCFLAVLQIDSLCPWGLKVLAYISHNNWWLVYLHRTTTKDESDALHWCFQFVCICQVPDATWCNTLQLWDSQRFFHKSWTCTSSSSIGRSIQKLICSQCMSVHIIEPIFEHFAFKHHT